MVDKYEAKHFIEERIGSGYTIPTIGVWDSFDEIDFDMLPEQFVLKCTHGSGSIVFVEDKDKFDKKEAKRILEKALGINYYWIGREWPYKNVKSRIIAKQYINDLNKNELMDFILFCFGGKVRIIFVDFDHTLNHIGKRNIYDRQWEYLPFSIGYPSVPEKIIEKPKCLKK